MKIIQIYFISRVLLLIPTSQSLFKLQEATPSVLPAFEDIEPQVRREWVRRAGDQALREYLDQLRDDGDVRIF